LPPECPPPPPPLDPCDIDPPPDDGDAERDEPMDPEAPIGRDSIRMLGVRGDSILGLIDGLG